MVKQKRLRFENTIRVFGFERACQYYSVNIVFEKSEFAVLKRKRVKNMQINFSCQNFGEIGIRA